MSFAFADPFAFALGIAIGIVIGMALAGLILMEQKPHHWIIITRLHPKLYHRLRSAAKSNSISVSEEIEGRLQASFDQ